jgi:hypothetical protein
MEGRVEACEARVFRYKQTIHTLVYVPIAVIRIVTAHLQIPRCYSRTRMQHSRHNTISLGVLSQGASLCGYWHGFQRLVFVFFVAPQ